VQDALHQEITRNGFTAQHHGQQFTAQHLRCDDDIRLYQLDALQIFAIADRHYCFSPAFELFDR
jgi:hypothetical protein